MKLHGKSEVLLEILNQMRIPIMIAVAMPAKTSAFLVSSVTLDHSNDFDYG